MKHRLLHLIFRLGALASAFGLARPLLHAQPFQPLELNSSGVIITAIGGPASMTLGSGQVFTITSGATLSNWGTVGGAGLWNFSAGTLTFGAAQVPMTALIGNGNQTINTLTVSSGGAFTGSFSTGSISSIGALAWIIENQQDIPMGAVDPDYTLTDWNGGSTPNVANNFQVAAVVANGAAFTTTPSGAWALWAQAGIYRSPEITIWAEADSCSSTINVGFGQHGGSNYVYAFYNQTTTTAYLQVSGPNGSVYSGSTSVGFTTTPHLGLSIADQYVSILWQPDYVTKIQTLTTSSMSVVATGLDFRVPATLANMAAVIGGATSSPVVWKRVVSGYTQGSGLANIARVTMPDGQPAAKDGHLYYQLASKALPEVKGDFATAVASMQAGIYEWDSNNDHMKLIANLATLRGGVLYGENSGCGKLNYNGSGDWLIPSWSTYVSGVTPALIYWYHTPVLPRGETVLTNGTLLSLPGDGADISDYDPDLYYANGTYTLMYVHKVEGASLVYTASTSTGSASISVSSTTGLFVGQPVSGAGIAASTTISTLSGGSTITLSAPVTTTSASDSVTFAVGGYAPYIATASTISGPWTISASYSGGVVAGATIEGCKIFNAGNGTIYYLAADYGAGCWDVFNSSMALTATIANPLGGYVHPNVFGTPDGSLRAVDWNTASSPAAANQAFYGGQVLSLRSTTSTSGPLFPSLYNYGF